MSPFLIFVLFVTVVYSYIQPVKVLSQIGLPFNFLKAFITFDKAPFILKSVNIFLNMCYLPPLIVHRVRDQILLPEWRDEIVYF